MGEGVSRPLTERQQQVYDFVRDKIVSRGYGPTVREIGESLSIRSPNGVMCHLKALERKGMIQRVANKSRAIELAEFVDRERTTHITIAGKLVGELCAFSESPQESIDVGNWMQGAHLAVQVVGDDLREANFHAGDLLVLLRQSTALPGQIALVNLGEEGHRLVYWMPEPNRVRLQPLNTRLATRFVENAEIVAVLVGLLRQFP